MKDIMHKQNLALLLDFINANSKEERENFFHDNRAYFDTLVWFYRNFKNEFYKGQRENIKRYYSRICDETRTKPRREGRFTMDEWWCFSYGRVLGIYLYLCSSGKTEHRIGIECGFKNEDFKNPLGEFHIYVASWAGDNFSPYEDAIRKTFPDRFINDKFAKNRVFIPVAVLDPYKQEDAIIATLVDTYNKLKAILNPQNA